MFTGDQPDLLDLWVFREDSIYVVGKDGIPQHYDGTEWLPVRTENANPLMGIWASDEKNIYAVGIGVQRGALLGLYPRLELRVGRLVVGDIGTNRVGVQAEPGDDHRVIAGANSRIAIGDFAGGLEGNFLPKARQVQHTQRALGSGTD